jgi:methylglutaconyl-CoA hydratase
MSDVYSELYGPVCVITLNRTKKHNAFDDVLLQTLQMLFETAINDSAVKVILLAANGKHFCAGADLAWMQRMLHYTEEENFADAMILGTFMHTLYHCPKPTVVAVQGAAFGGGAGLVAACDIAIAAHTATFSFAEVKLGLIPAIISPYVIQAVGARIARWLFMTGEVLTADQAELYHLVHQCRPSEELFPFTLDYAKQLAALPPEALQACKSLVTMRASIDEQTVQHSATLIAKQRVSPEAQAGLHAFLTARGPHVS